MTWKKRKGTPTIMRTLIDSDDMDVIVDVDVNVNVDVNVHVDVDGDQRRRRQSPFDSHRQRLLLQLDRVSPTSRREAGFP